MGRPLTEIDEPLAADLVSRVLAGGGLKQTAAAAGLSSGVLRRIIVSRTTPEQRRAGKSAAVSRSLVGTSRRAGLEPWNKGLANAVRETPDGKPFGVSSGPVYARDVPGRWWPSAMAAGRALACGRSSVVWALATGRPCRGMVLTNEPPPWRLAELAAAERRREQELVVRPWWAAVGPGPAAKNCEQRYVDKERRMA